MFYPDFKAILCFPLEQHILNSFYLQKVLLKRCIQQFHNSK